MKSSLYRCSCTWYTQRPVRMLSAPNKARLTFVPGVGMRTCWPAVPHRPDQGQQGDTRHYRPLAWLATRPPSEGHPPTPLCPTYPSGVFIMCPEVDWLGVVAALPAPVTRRVPGRSRFRGKQSFEGPELATPVLFCCARKILDHPFGVVCNFVHFRV